MMTWPSARVRSRRSVVRERPRLEKAEQADVVKVLELLGASVWITGTRRRKGAPCPGCGTFVPESQSTRMTPGLPDLFAFLPARGARPPLLLVIEMKRTDGTLSPDQHRFAGCCQAAGIRHVSGAAAAVVEWLEAEGYLVTAARRA